MPRFQGIPVEQSGGRFGGIPVEQPVIMQSAPQEVTPPLSFQGGNSGFVASNASDTRPFGYGTMGQAKEYGKKLGSHAGTALEQLGQGVTASYGDEVGDFLGSLAATPFTTNGRGLGDTLADNLKFSRGQTQARLKEQTDEYPVTSLLSNLAGGLMLAGGLGGTSGGSQVGNFARSNTFGPKPSAGNTLARIGKEGALGAAAGAVIGSGAAADDKKLEGAGSGAFLGGIGGAAIPAVTGAYSGLGSLVDKGAKPVLDLASKYGIPTTLAQATDSPTVRTLQKISQELPLSGETGFRRKQQSAWQSQLLKTVGVEGDRITPEVIDEAFTKVGKKFDDAIPDGPINTNGTNFWRDGFTNKLETIKKNAASKYDSEARGILDSNISYVLENIGDSGPLEGAKLRAVRNALNENMRGTNVSGASDLIRRVESAVIDLGTSGDPNLKKMLTEAKKQYKNLLAIEPLAKKSIKGRISAPELAGQVGQVYGRSYTRGKAGEIGDLARIGKELMPTLGGSDTWQKLALSGGAGIGAAGAGVFNPLLVGLTLAGNRASQSLINRNPAVIRAISNAPQEPTGAFGLLGQAPSLLRTP